MPLTNMKRTKADRKKDRAEQAIDTPSFPYGLSLDLDKDSLQKLGFKDLPDVGEKMNVVAVGVVTSANEHKSERSSHRSITVQLQQLDVSPARTKTAVDAVSDSLK